MERKKIIFFLGGAILYKLLRIIAFISEIFFLL